MGNKQGSLGNHLDTASKTGALAFPGKVKFLIKSILIQLFRKNLFFQFVISVSKIFHFAN